MSIKDGILDLPIKRYWFNQIKDGTKTHEYRNSAIWRSKLGANKSNNYSYVRFRCGQLTQSKDKKNVLLGKILSIKLIDGAETDLRVNHEVYDIEFEIIKE